MLLVTLRLLPRRLLSRLVGRVAGLRRPRFFAAALRDFFVRRYGLAMPEAELAQQEYPSLAELFTRRLRPGARPVGSAMVVSPADGRLDTCGAFSSGRLVQCKGIEYGVAELLGDPEAAADFQEGAFMTIYLSPRDYHRVHLPVDGEILATWRVGGDLWPVNEAATRGLPGLFHRNERWISLLNTPHGKVAVVMVGALNVGSVELCHLPGSRLKAGERNVFHVPPPARRGAEYGLFKLGGSTVILLLSREFNAGLDWSGLLPGPLRCGQNLLGHCRSMP